MFCLSSDDIVKGAINFLRTVLLAYYFEWPSSLTQQLYIKRATKVKAISIPVLGKSITSLANPIRFWIEASDSHGLSFSSTFNQTKFTIDLLGRFQKNKTKISTAYWILKDSKWIPLDMAFKQDPKNPEHYLLVVTKRMKISTLVNNLKLISHRMTVMTGISLEVRKDA